MITRHCAGRLLSIRSAGAALALAAGLAAPAAWGATAEITSRTGADNTYTPVGTPDEIEVTVTFDAAVAVSGQPVFQLVVGSRTRNMDYQGGSGTAKLIFEYTVQTGDLDEDGVSYRADALRGGSITDNADGTAVDRRVPALARDANHKVDGVAPRPVSVQVTSNPLMGGAYATGQDVVVEVRFDETIDGSGTGTSLELDFDGQRRSATRTLVSGNTATFTYRVVDGDIDGNGFAVPANRLTVADTFDNTAERTTPVLRTAQRIDGVAPRVSRAAIVSSAGADQTYRAGDRIVVDATFSERVQGAAGSTFAILVGTADSPTTRQAAYLAGEGTSRIRYAYVVGTGDSDPDGISFAADALTGAAITDRAGNDLPADAVPAAAEQANHKVDGGVDNEPPRVRGVAVTSQPERNRTYAARQTIEVTVRFDEPVEVTGAPTLRLSFGERFVEALFDTDSNNSAALRFSHVVGAADSDPNGIAIPPLVEALVGGTIEDGSGNTAIREFAALADQPGHRVDGVVPEVEQATVVSSAGDDDTYALGDVIEVAVTFSEPVVAGHAPDLKLGIGIGLETRLAYLASGEGTRRLRFRYRVQQDDLDDDGIAIATDAFTGGAAEDIAGNPAVAAQPGLVLPDQPAHQVDASATAAATVTVVSNAGADETYGLGDVIELDVVFDEAVVVTGTPELVLSFGDAFMAPEPDPEDPTPPTTLLPHSRHAQLVRQRPRVLTFRYEVAPGDVDRDGLSVDANALVGGDIVDAFGNPARLLTAASNLEAHKVDGIVPVPVAGIEITSDAGADGTYGFGDGIDFAVSFSEVVHVTEFDGSRWWIRHVIGGNIRLAGFVGGSGTATLRFRYVVQAQDRDDDGISLEANSLVCSPEPTDCTIEDNAGNGVRPRLQGLPAQPRHRVDGRRYQASLVIDSTPEGGVYGDGDPIDLTLTFPDPVFVLRSGAPPLPELALSIGGAERRAAFNGGSGTRALRFRYTVQGGDDDRDGISVAAGPGSLVGGLIRDADGGAVPRYFDALPADDGHRVDAVRARAQSAEIVSTPAAGSEYGFGETIEIEVTFDELVYVTEDDSELALLIGVGANTRRAAYAEGSGTPTLSFRYAVQADDRDEDGISVGPDAIVGGVIEDAAGNASTAEQRRIPALPASPGHKVNPELDQVAPTVVDVREPPGPTAYGTGDAINVEVVFDEEVHVSGEPVLDISIGAHTRTAAYAEGSGTETLTFRYTVVDDDFDEDGISIGPGANSLTGGTIEDSAGNAAVRDFEGRHWPGQTVHARPRTMVDTVRIKPPPQGQFFREDDPIDVDVEFTDVVHVAGESALELSIGARNRSAAYLTGSGTDTLTFRYTVVDGDFDGDGISIRANALAGGAITDGAGAAAQLGFEALPPGDRPLRVDAVPATVKRIWIASNPPAGGYGEGDSIEIDVVFDEKVLVTGDPVVALSVGAATRYAVFAGGGGTETLAFAYVVQPGDVDDDGISLPANSLAGGTITDLAGNDVVRDFKGLAAHPGHPVSAAADIVAPRIEDVAIVSGPGIYTPGEAIEVEVTFDEKVHVSGGPAVVLGIGANDRRAAYAEGSGTRYLLFRYEVAEDDYDDDGIAIGPAALVGGTITDQAGNEAVRDFEGLEADGRHRVRIEVPDVVAPRIDGVEVISRPATDGIYTPGEAIEVAVAFDEEVHVSGGPAVVLGVGANDRRAAYAEGSGTRRLLFRYEVAEDDYDDDGIAIGPAALVGGTIEDASGNAVNRLLEAQLFPEARVWPNVDLVLAPLTVEAGREQRVDLAAELAAAGVVYLGDFEVASDTPEVAGALALGSMLTVRGLFEGTATITATARRAPITIALPVTVEASVAEVAVLQHALAAVGRGLLSGAVDTVGGRLENIARGVGGRGGGSVFGAAGQSPAAMAHGGSALHRDGAGGVFGGPSDPFAAFGGSGAGFGALPGQRSGFLGGGRPVTFAIPLRALANPALGIGVWGGGDVQTFEGDPDEGAYDGRLTTVHIGADAIGDGWVAGASVSRSRAEVSYAFDRETSGAGTLDVDLTAVYPYLQWAPDNGAVFWAILGFGSGEAQARRDGGPVREPGDLSMSLGVAGMRVALGAASGVEFALRGDGGVARTETEQGLYAIQGIAAGAQRLRAGVEASWPMAAADGELTPFVDLGGRWDGGDGVTGGAAEVVGGIRYRGTRGGFEVKGRTLALHGAEGYSESGAAASVFLAPKSDGRGLSLSLTPRKGVVESTADLWRTAQPLPDRPRTGAAWSFDGRIGYGFGLRARQGTVTPFAEAATARHGARSRLGMGYESGAQALGSLRIEMAAERHDPAGGRIGYGLGLTVEARF